jgi:hypothetical protein
MISNGRKPVSMSNLNSVIFECGQLSLDASALRKAAKSHRFLKGFYKGNLICGIITGQAEFIQPIITHAIFSHHTNL